MTWAGIPFWLSWLCASIWVFAMASALIYARKERLLTRVMEEHVTQMDALIRQLEVQEAQWESSQTKRKNGSPSVSPRSTPPS